MRFSLLVNAAAESAAALTALHTAQALHNPSSDHQLYCLFLYRDAVHLANRHAWTGDAEQASAAQQWQQWIASQSVEAMVCVGAAQRRGVVDSNAATTLAALINSDRVIQFG
jgi:tRNA 2-thiouridine synthesizing protein D